MRITIGKGDKSKCEEVMHTLKIILTKKQAIHFSITRPITLQEFFKELRK